MSERHEDDRREMWRGVKVLAISWVMAGAIVGGGVLGWWIDTHWTGTFPLMTLIGIGAGIVGGGWFAYRTILEALRN